MSKKISANRQFGKFAVADAEALWTAELDALENLKQHYETLVSASGFAESYADVRNAYEQALYVFVDAIRANGRLTLIERGET